MQNDILVNDANNVFKSKYGEWALVTGASSGIGLEFAEQLAGKGLNLVLAARRKSVLDQVAAQLREKHGVEVRTLVIDLSQKDILNVVDEATKDIDVGLLVNNAGAETHGGFLKLDVDDAARLVQLNATAPMELAHYFGKRMAAKGRGGVIFVASGMGYQAVPYFANYAATKAYVLSLGEALHLELKPKGVDVTVVSPGLTDTAMPEKMSATLDFSKMPIRLMPVKPVVETALDALGKKASVIPGGRNKVFAFLNKRILSRKSGAAMFGGIFEKALDQKLV